MRTACLMMLVCAGGLTASDDRDERDRAARVALALAAKPAPTRAPAPRPVPKNYRDGYKAATVDQVPLVVFVACQPKQIAGAHVTKVDALGDVTGPAVVVGFPIGERLFIDATLQGDPTQADVTKAVEAARRKIEVPPAKRMPAAPKPLSWDL